MKRLLRSAVLATCLAVVSCATPQSRIAEFAAQQHFQPKLLQGGGFTMLAYQNTATAPSDVLHVYLEHDGLAWIDAENVSADPTPRHALMLGAMAHDAAPSLYLGRPCYFGRHTDAGCGPLLWTHRRYSDTVVNAMAEALREFIATRRTTKLVWFGYSGGGALAMLLAERFPQTQAVITIAGNLDIAAWTALHHYDALEGSLNPADRPVLAGSIMQRHYVGERDRNIPAPLLESISVLPKGSVIRVRDFDHVCCWQAWWPNLLRSLDSQRVVN